MNRDFRDMLSALSGEGAEFLVAGAHALAVHGGPRATGELALWIHATEGNVRRVWRALTAFGAPLHDLAPEDLLEPDNVIQFGVPPGRIDLLTAVSGCTFPDAWAGRVVVELEGLAIPVLGRAALVANKRTVGRAKDLADLEALGEA